MGNVKPQLRGQATTEMAIFGSLILVAFSVLLSYAQRMTEQQALQQQAFRMALKKSFDENASVSYTILKTPRNVNIFGGFGEGNRGSLTANATVTWTKGASTKNYAYYQINEDLISLPLYTKDMTPSKPPAEKEYRDFPAQVWNVLSDASTVYSGKDVKDETAANIVTTRSSSLQDTITTTLKLRYQVEARENPGDPDPPYYDAPDIVITQGLDTDGRYRGSAAGTTVNRQRGWITAF